MIRVPLSVRFESIHDPPGGHTPGDGIEKDMENRLSKGENLYETEEAELTAESKGLEGVYEEP